MENYRLGVFRAVAEHLSFRRAAEALHISQPAVSKHVQLLEEEVGAALFDRSGRRVELTTAGAVLLRRAGESLRVLEGAVQEVAALQGKVSGVLRLAASTTIAQYLLPAMLGRFVMDHPEVELAAVSGNTERVVRLLVEGRVESGMIEGPARSRLVRTERFCADRMVLLAATDAGARRTLTAAQLTKVPLLLREQGSGSRRVVELALRQAKIGLKELRVVMELDSTEAIVSGVEAGLGWGFVPERAAARSLELGRVVAVPVRGVVMTREFRLAQAVGMQLSAAGAAFAAYARAEEGRASGGQRRVPAIM